MIEETNKEIVWCLDGIMHAIYAHEDDVSRAICGTAGRYRRFFYSSDERRCKRCLKVIRARGLVDVSEQRWPLLGPSSLFGVGF